MITSLTVFVLTPMRIWLPIDYGIHIKSKFASVSLIRYYTF